MKTIIAGSRYYTDFKKYYAFVELAIIQSKFKITEIVSGDCRGIDKMGETWAKANNIPIKLFSVTKADWAEYGTFAGPRRNGFMAKYADALICLPDSRKRSGSLGMIDLAKKAGLAIHICYPHLVLDLISE